jgi:hypothetical protein
MIKGKKEEKVNLVGIMFRQRSDPHLVQREKVDILCVTKHVLAAGA